jgi:hypothetical protein
MLYEWLLDVDEEGEKAVLSRRRPLVRRGGEKDWNREERILVDVVWVVVRDAVVETVGIV